MNKQEYLQWLERIMIKYDLDGGFIHASYIRGVEQEDFTPCYIDDRVRNSKKLRKELNMFVAEYLEDYPEATRPMYS